MRQLVVCSCIEETVLTQLIREHTHSDKYEDAVIPTGRHLKKAVHDYNQSASSASEIEDRRMESLRPFVSDSLTVNFLPYIPMLYKYIHCMYIIMWTRIQI